VDGRRKWRRNAVIRFFNTDTKDRGPVFTHTGAELLKGGKVDGIYTADPKKVTDAKLFDFPDFDQAVEGRYAVIWDATVFLICRDHHITIRVFDMTVLGATLRLWAQLQGFPWSRSAPLIIHHSLRKDSTQLGAPMSFDVEIKDCTATSIIWARSAHDFKHIRTGRANIAAIEHPVEAYGSRMSISLRV
jgi:hypothetical protein